MGKFNSVEILIVENNPHDAELYAAKSINFDDFIKVMTNTGLFWFFSK